MRPLKSIPFRLNNKNDFLSYNNSSIDWLAPSFDIHSDIVNIVGLLQFPFSFDLDFFAANWINAIYDKKKIPCVRIPFLFNNFNVVALVYHSGKVVITGFNDLLFIHKVWNIISLFYLSHSHLPFYSFNFSFFKISNVVATIDFKQPIDLFALSLHFSFIKFNPELFPAAIFFAPNLINIHASVLIYNNGKCVIAGAKHIFLAHITAQFTAFVLLRNFAHIDRFNFHFF